jgi:hypothetical protein
MIFANKQTFFVEKGIFLAKNDILDEFLHINLNYSKCIKYILKNYLRFSKKTK